MVQKFDSQIWYKLQLFYFIVKVTYVCQYLFFHFFGKIKEIKYREEWLGCSPQIEI